MAFTRNNKYIFTLVVKNKQDDEIFLNHISSAIIALENAMKILDTESVKIFKKGNDLDSISWLSIEQMF